MKEIKLRQGMVALVDDKNYEWLNQWNWFQKKDGNTYYAYRREYISGKGNNRKYRQYSMHRMILDTPKNMLVDHRDFNGLNNQRNNIRNCTHADNSRHIKPRSNTGYLGVSKRIRHNQNGTKIIFYTMSIKCNGKWHRGYFKDVIEAARAYDKKAKVLFGKFANLNFKI